jgi:hypothetical protein
MSTDTASSAASSIAKGLDPGAGNLMGRQSTLSEWAGPYVTSMLGKAQALSEQPYQTYQGPLTAGAAPLQMQAFQGIGGLAPAQGLGTAQNFATQAGQSAQGMGYTPSQFQSPFQAPSAFEPGTFQGGTFNTQQAQQYMNPYLQTALNPALEEARRQAEISRTQQAGRLAQAGAFGGSRQAIMESELNRNLMQAQNKMIGEGYASAYDKAMAQYNADMARSMQAQQLGEQSRQFGAGQGMQAAQLAAQYGSDAQRQAEQSRQFGATYGLEGLAKQLAAAQTLGSLAQTASAEQRANLAQQLAAGAQQRDIEQQGIAADLAEFQTQRDYPYKMLQFQQSMLQGMPIQSVAAQYQQPTSLSSTINTMGGLMGLYEKLFPTGK